MAFNYNKPVFEDSPPPDSIADPALQPAPIDPVALSPAVLRFRSCRWRRAPEEGSTIDCCSHRDVLPMAGTTGFDPQAWCPDCGFYKLRRTPKKRSLDDYRY